MVYAVLETNGLSSYCNIQATNQASRVIDPSRARDSLHPLDDANVNVYGTEVCGTTFYEKISSLYSLPCEAGYPTLRVTCSTQKLQISEVIFFFTFLCATFKQTFLTLYQAFLK